VTSSVAGLVALNALFLVAGLGILFPFGVFATWGHVVRLAGVAYLAGFAAVTLIAVELVVAGHVPGVAAVIAVTVATVVVGIVAARRRGVTLPARVRGSAGDEPLLWVALACISLALVLLESIVRVAHTQGEVGGDSIAIWTPRAKIIHFYGLDAQLWDMMGGQTYPILVPTLQALDFAFMGGVDTVALHLQYSFLLIGFVFAIAGLLRPRVPLVLVWPVLLLFLVMPNFDYWALVPQADLPLQYLFVCAAIVAWRWIEERAAWQLALFGLWTAASMATKREGQLLAACLVLTVFAATAREWRRRWPGIAAAAAAAVLVNLPWRLWFHSHDFTGETPGATLGQLLDHAGRIPPSAWLVARLTFGWHDWLLAAPLGLVAAALAVAWGSRPLAAYFLGLCALIVAGFIWILWSIDSLPIAPTDVTPMPRAVGALVLLALAFAPLLLSSVERSVRR
jgi:hypothetical protein